MSFDSSSMDLGLRLASCLCEVTKGKRDSRVGFGVPVCELGNMRKISKKIRKKLASKGMHQVNPSELYSLWENHEFDSMNIRGIP